MTLLKVKFNRHRLSLDTGNGHNQNNPALTTVSAAIITILLAGPGNFDITLANCSPEGDKVDNYKLNTPE